MARLPKPGSPTPPTPAEPALPPSAPRIPASTPRAGTPQAGRAARAVVPEPTPEPMFDEPDHTPELAKQRDLILARDGISERAQHERTLLAQWERDLAKNPKNPPPYPATPAIDEMLKAHGRADLIGWRRDTL